MLAAKGLLRENSSVDHRKCDRLSARPVCFIEKVGIFDQLSVCHVDFKGFSPFVFVHFCIRRLLTLPTIAGRHKVRHDAARGRSVRLLLGGTFLIVFFFFVVYATPSASPLWIKNTTVFFYFFYSHRSSVSLSLIFLLSLFFLFPWCVSSL